MEIIALWLIFTILVALYARSKGRSGFIAFIVSLLLSPLIGFLIYAVLPALTSEVEKRYVKAGTMKRCPYCAELVRIEAIICKHCGKELDAPKPAEPWKTPTLAKNNELGRVQSFAKSNFTLYRWVAAHDACRSCKERELQNPYSVSDALAGKAPVPGRDSHHGCRCTLAAETD